MKKSKSNSNSNSNSKLGASPASKKILIGSGVNLDLLGTRQPEIYGHATLGDMENLVRKRFDQFFLRSMTSHFELVFFQTNDECKFLEELTKPYAGAVINAGAWSHTSLAIADRLVGVGLPYVEVHVSNVSRREEIRQKSLLSANARGVVYGFGIESYWVGLVGLIQDQLRPHLAPSRR